jgi:ABC-type multidrug transport system ATPase subunit
MVAIARGLMARPRLLMIDEPFLGLAPNVVDEILAIVQRINQEGVAVLFTEQNVQLALSVSHRGYLLESGRIVLEGSGRRCWARNGAARVLGYEAAHRPAFPETQREWVTAPHAPHSARSSPARRSRSRALPPIWA